MREENRDDVGSLQNFIIVEQVPFQPTFYIIFLSFSPWEIFVIQMYFYIHCLNHRRTPKSSFFNMESFKMTIA